MTRTPPIAERRSETITQHGQTRVSPYAWLKDDNWQTVMKDPSVLSPDIRAYLEAENAYTKAALEDPSEALREELFQEMRGRIKEDDSSCLLYTSPSPRDRNVSRMPSSA